MTLEVSGLAVTRGGLRLVDDFSFRIGPGQLHAVVGESGSGKTLSALAVMDLLPEGLDRTGAVRLGDKPLQGRRGLALVLQDASSALNPVRRIEAQLIETLRVHGAVGDLDAQSLSIAGSVELTRAELRAFPHQLSGGQRQRASIACALAASPQVLIADEPTTALDVSLRGTILALLKRLANERSMGVWLITHDLESARASDALTVMYAGRVVEQGATTSILSSPRHPYTEALLKSAPGRTPPGEPLPILTGSMPSASDVISGCRFHPRCPRVISSCTSERPPFRAGVACLRVTE